MVFCCIPRCPSSQTNDSSITFHAFPNNPDVAAKWIKNVNLFIPNGGTWFPQTGNVICCKHFLPHDFKPDTKFPCLKPASVPTVFQKAKPSTSDVVLNRSKVDIKSPLIVKVIKPTQEDDDDDMDMDDAPLSEMLKLPPHSTVINRVAALRSSFPNTVSTLHGNMPTQTTSNVSSRHVITYSKKKKNDSSHKQDQLVHAKALDNAIKNMSTKDNNTMDCHKPEDKENEQAVKKPKLGIKRKKKHSGNDLIEIGPSTFLKINPDVIKVTKKATPSGNTVLQFVMNPKLGLDASKIFQPVSKLTHLDKSTTKTKELPAGESKKISENNSLEIGDYPNSDEDIDTDDTAEEAVNLSNSKEDNYQHIAPVILSTNLPVNHPYSFSLQQKYNANIRQKNRQIQLLKLKVDKLTKKIDELETKCIVQERQLDFPNLKKLRLIKKNAAKGESHANFIFEQIRGYNGNVPVRWSESTMTQCSVWCRKAPYAYEYFKKADLFRLPCIGTVKRYMKKHPEITTQIKNRIIGVRSADSDDSSSDFEFDEDDEEEDEEPNNEDSVSSTSNMPCETILHVSHGLTDENSQAVEAILPSSSQAIRALNLSTSHSVSGNAQVSNKIVDFHGQIGEEKTDQDHNVSQSEAYEQANIHDVNSVTEEIIVESTGNDQVKNIYIHPNQEGGITTLNLNGQEIILQPGNIIHLNSEVSGIDGVENQYFVIPTVEDHTAGNDNQLANAQPVSFVIQEGENDEQIIYITEHPGVVTDAALGLTN